MKNKEYGFTVGITSLMMVFVVLCITVFATLFYVQANSNNNMVLRTYEYSKDYYDADSEAVLYLSDLNEQLNSTNDFQKITKLLNAKTIYEDDVYKFQVNINDFQMLNVECKLEYEDYYQLKVVKWKKVVNNDANYENHGFDF